MKLIFHVDMDSFFSAVEVRENPELRGLPVVVGGPKAGEEKAVEEPDKRIRGVVSTCSYEARECARMIKREILEKEGLTCSVGIAPNKTIAKIASDFVKPDGLTVVEEEKAREFLTPLPVKKIPGVGPKTEETLKRMGIEQVGQLASCDVQKLVAAFGKYGTRLHLIANGIDESEVEEEWERKSLSRERTFAEDTKDVSVLNDCVDGLAEDVYNAIKREGFVFKTVAIKVKFEDFVVCTRAKTLKSFQSELSTLKKAAKGLMAEFSAGKGNGKGKEKKIRLVGVRVSNLGVVDQRQRRIV